MKNTEYKDVFDFGEEALSMNNKFPANSFPSIKNAFTIGENIRGMKNVSPLATVKFFNQSTEDLLAKYYPDAQNIKSNNNNLVLDESIKKNGYDFYKYEFFSDKNRNGSVEKNEELIFKLLLFVSTDGNKVKECYEVVKPADDEIIFFLETDDDTLSDEVLFGRISEKIKKLYTDHASGKLYKTFFDGDILDKIKKHSGNINQEIIEELFLKGYIEKKGIKQGFFTFLKYTLIGISAPAKALGWVLNKLGNGIDFLKISDEVWDTENETYYFQKDKLIENLTISSDKLKSLKNFFTDKKDIDVLGSDILKVVLDSIILQQIVTLEAFIETYNNYVKEEIEEIFKTLGDLPPSDSPSLSERIALICGIWNGLIDFVSSIFKFLGSLLEAPFDISKNFQQTLEMIDTFWKMLRDGTLYKNMKSSINYGMTQIVQYLKKNSDDINWVRIYYIGGFSLAFLGTFFIPLANVAKIANAGKLGEILAKINSEVGKTISQTAKFVKVNSIQAYQKVSRALIDLLEIFNVGGQKLKKFADDLWKKIAEWFVKNKKLIEATWKKAQLYFSKESKYDAIYRDITKKFFIQNIEVMSESQFYKLASKIKQTFKIDLLIVDRNSEKYGELFKRWQNNPVYAVFHEKTFVNSRYGLELEGPTVYFFKGMTKASLLIEITAYTMQHELLHLKLWHKMVIEFPELAGLYRKIPRVLDELNVVGEMLKQNTKKISKWSLQDIQNDIDIINNNPKWKPYLKEYFGKENVEINDFKNWDLSKYLKQIK